jgi:O-antigen/teichoic acid export membrane protein
VELSKKVISNTDEKVRGSHNLSSSGLSGKIVRGVGWNFFGQLSVVLFTFLYSIAVSRILGPEDYGILTLVISLCGTLVVFASLGTEHALNKFVPTYRTKDRDDQVIGILEWLTLMRGVTVIATAVLLYFFSDWVAATAFGKPDIAIYIRFAAFIVIPYGMQGLYQGFVTSYYEQRFVNIALAFAKGTTFTLAILLLWLNYSIAGALAAELAAWSILLFLLSSKSSNIVKSLRSKKIGKVNLRKVMKYSSFLYFFAVVNFVLGQQLDVIMLGKLWSDPAEIAYYFIGYNLAYFAVSFFTMALAGGISLTLYSELYARKDFDGLRKLFSAY